MEIYDSHLHLGQVLDLNKSFSNLINNCKLAQVKGGLIISMQSDPWDFQRVSELIGLEASFKFAMNPDLSLSREQLKSLIKKGKSLGFAALKIHPRLQKVNLQSNTVRVLVKLAEEFDLPIIICAFDDGSWCRIGMTNSQFINLADDFPGVQFLWAHAGGHRVLDFMFMARRVRNVFLDTSFTQSYFFKGRILEDLNYATESLSTRFMFGTDFENNNYSESVFELKKYYLQQNGNRNAFFKENFKAFLGIND